MRSGKVFTANIFCFCSEVFSMLNMITSQVQWNSHNSNSFDSKKLSKSKKCPGFFNGLILEIGEIKSNQNVPFCSYHDEILTILISKILEIKSK